MGRENQSAGKANRRRSKKLELWAQIKKVKTLTNLKPRYRSHITKHSLNTRTHRAASTLVPQAKRNSRQKMPMRKAYPKSKRAPRRHTRVEEKNPPARGTKCPPLTSRRIHRAPTRAKSGQYHQGSRYVGETPMQKGSRPVCLGSGPRYSRRFPGAKFLI